MSVSFDRESAQRYAFANGRKPRGFGAWQFRLHRSGASTPFRFTGNYIDAKKAAMREARKIGCEEVSVDA